MKKILVLCAAMMLCASSAFAVGADLSTGACPGVAGASADGGPIDCANFGFNTLLGVFQPAEASPDLAGIDIVIDIQVGGDVGSDASFWDFGGTEQAAIGSSHARPTGSPAPCAAYTATWQPSGSGAGSLGVARSPNVVRIVALAYRPTGLAVTLDQKLFGFQLSIDATNASENGSGVANGCSKPACFVLNSIQPRMVSGVDGANLTSGSIFGNQVTFNGGTAAQCLAVPTRKQTWGQLKSLYR